MLTQRLRTAEDRFHEWHALHPVKARIFIILPLATLAALVQMELLARAYILLAG